jgi:hypothetical protein
LKKVTWKLFSKGIPRSAILRGFKKGADLLFSAKGKFFFYRKPDFLVLLEKNCFGELEHFFAQELCAFLKSASKLLFF